MARPIPALMRSSPGARQRCTMPHSSGESHPIARRQLLPPRLAIRASSPRRFDQFRQGPGHQVILPGGSRSSGLPRPKRPAADGPRSQCPRQQVDVVSMFSLATRACRSDMSACSAALHFGVRPHPIKLVVMGRGDVMKPRRRRRDHALAVRPRGGGSSRTPVHIRPAYLLVVG